MTDPIADMLTRIRNAQRVGHESVLIPYSKMKESVLKVIHSEGFISDFEVLGEGAKKTLVATLKYYGRKAPVITGLKRVSKPGRRVYCGSDELKRIGTGIGAVIVSTSKGVMTDKQAQEAMIGGEVLCRIW